MDLTKILMWANSGLLLIVAFFVRRIFTTIDRLEEDLKGRPTSPHCEKTHDEVNKYLHHHAKTGSSGEEVMK